MSLASKLSISLSPRQTFSVGPGVRDFADWSLRSGSALEEYSQCRRSVALTIANDYNTPVQMHISVGRIEGGYPVVKALDAMLTGSPHVTLVKDQWYQWPIFRQWVRSMNLLMQPSFTESFNMVTADGAAECVPSVVSDAIDWAPSDWKAEMDDANDIARIGKILLATPDAGQQGYRALQRHDAAGLREWKSWLGMTVC